MDGVHSTILWSSSIGFAAESIINDIIIILRNIAAFPNVLPEFGVFHQGIVNDIPGFYAVFLLYVAVADLIPGLHRRIDPRSSITQVLLIGCGIAIIAFAENHAH